MSGGLDTFDLIQIGLNVALLICLSLLLLWIRRSGPGVDGRRLYKSAEEFLAASEELAARFEDNLREKRVLINELVGELDAKTAQIRGLLKQADQAAADLAAGLKPRADHEPERTDKTGRVLSLHDEGLSTSQIATRLRLPKAEIETILSLRQKR